jgi:DNA-binding transcriptional ArsR family regulator
MPRNAIHYLDAAQLRVLASPLRQEILSVLCREPLSAARLTARLERPPANLHYHLDQLRRAGLIELIEERPVRGATEKFFRAIASNFSIAPAAFASLPGGAAEHELLPMIRGHAEWTLRELSRAMPDAEQPPLTSHQRVRLTAAAAARLRVRLIEWLEECRSADGDASDDGPLEEWLLFTAFFGRVGGGE